MAFFSNLISKLKDGLTKTRETLVSGLKSLILGRKLDEQLIDDVETMLLQADVGTVATQKLIDSARADFRSGKLKESSDLLAHLKAGLKEMLAVERDGAGQAIRWASSGTTVILVTGINGAGKTTSIAKLAYMLRQQNKSVLLAACDTFRAGAVRQLEIWSERLGVELIKGQQGGDPAAVAFDACKAAVARNVDVLIVDTAGRLQTQDPLMRQLAKINGVIAKQIVGGPHETLLVLDATAGQNALRQAEEFAKASPITGIVLAKLDGTAKGGVVVAIRTGTNVPVKFVGVGERPEDLQTFDSERFVEALFSE
jgi:fused signal recognition particle receptor